MVLPLENAVPPPETGRGGQNAGGEGNAAAFLALLAALLGESVAVPSPVRPETLGDAPSRVPVSERKEEEGVATAVLPLVAPLLAEVSGANAAVTSRGTGDVAPGARVLPEVRAAPSPLGGTAGHPVASARSQDAPVEATDGRGTAARFVGMAGPLQDPALRGARELRSSWLAAAGDASGERGTAPAPAGGTDSPGPSVTADIAGVSRMFEAMRDSVIADRRVRFSAVHQTAAGPEIEAEGTQAAGEIVEAAVTAVEGVEGGEPSRVSAVRDARGTRRAAESAGSLSVHSVTLEASAGGADRPAASELAPSAVAQVREQIVRALERGMRAIRVRLEPPDLGTVDIRVRELGGRLEVTLAASRPEVQQALEAGREGLRTALAASGFTVQRVEVQPMLSTAGHGMLTGGQTGMGWGSAQQGFGGDASPWRAAGAVASEHVPSVERQSWPLEPEGTGLVDTRA